MFQHPLRTLYLGLAAFWSIFFLVDWIRFPGMYFFYAWDAVLVAIFLERARHFQDWQ